MIRKILHIYDLKQNGTLDLYYVPDVFYALGKNPTLIMLAEVGQAEKEGDKFITINLAYKRIIKALQKTDHEQNQMKVQVNLPRIKKTRQSPPPQPDPGELDEDEYRDYLIEEPYSQ